MAEHSSTLVQVEVRCDRTAPFAVRQVLRKLDSLGQVLGDLVLIASELVSNAVLYSGCSKEDVIKVRLDRARDHLLLSVWDPGVSGRSATVAVAEQRAFGGFGLRLVERLARCWGTERADGYRVWAEVALSAPTRRGTRPLQTVTKAPSASAKSNSSCRRIK
jgi:anti-sigma regulatory factor (Ser/Thr protein kinase)